MKLQTLIDKLVARKDELRGKADRDFKAHQFSQRGSVLSTRDAYLETSGRLKEIVDTIRALELARDLGAED